MQIAVTIPKQRLADPREIAAALFLLSDVSSYMKGRVFTVNGSYTTCWITDLTVGWDAWDFTFHSFVWR